MKDNRPKTTLEFIYIRLIIQSCFSLLVMIVCSYKIITAPDADGQRPVYWSALTSTAASWLPSPLSASKENDTLTNEIAGNQYNLERKPPDKL